MDNYHITNISDFDTLKRKYNELIFNYENLKIENKKLLDNLKLADEEYYKLEIKYNELLNDKIPDNIKCDVCITL